MFRAKPWVQPPSLRLARMARLTSRPELPHAARLTLARGLLIYVTIGKSFCAVYPPFH